MHAHPHPLPQVSQVFSAFPAGLIRHLRQVLEAPSPSDAFTCYCNLFEWLTTYLANLGNSVYKDRPIDLIDERLEAALRGTSSPISFGTAVGGARALAQSSLDFSPTIDELGVVLREARLPTACARLLKAFQLIRKARVDYEIPPSRLPSYLDANLPGDKTLSKCSFDAFLGELVTYRNRGMGHQAEESWFPRDRAMYALLVGFLAAALDELLTWEPMRALLTRYEVVSVETPEIHHRQGGRLCMVDRRHIADSYAPLGASFMLLGSGHKPEGAYVARRTDTPSELHAVVRYVHFPQTLQTSELLFRRYAWGYLRAYLERGLVTKPQRQGELDPMVRKLAIPDPERLRIESEIQQAINDYAPDEPDRRDPSLQRLAALIGPEWPQHQAQVSSLLAELPTRRKDHIFEQIDNNVIMSFDQLRDESELSEPDLETVLGELEQEGRVRRVGASPVDGAHGHYKAQDPGKPAQFRAIVARLRERANPRRRYPEHIGRLVDLCAALLADDGLGLPDEEIAAVRELFDAHPREAEPEEATADSMTLVVGDDTIHAESVRDLYEKVMALLRRRGVDPSPAIPFFIGRTRYLVNHTPTHANGTAFKAPVAIGALHFEANRTRERGLLGMINFLAQLGIEATSPEVSPAPLDADEGGDLDEAIEESDGATLGLEVLGEDGTPTAIIEGPTVRRFFTALLSYLLDHGAPLEAHVPVRAGRIRYLLAEEPYHDNGRRFDGEVHRGGYYMNTAFSYEQALAHALALCEKLAIQARPRAGSPANDRDTSVPLQVSIGDAVIEGPDVPTFLENAIYHLFRSGLLTDEDIPYKSGRVRYLISDVPTHDHGRDFIRPVEINLDHHRYFIETNVSRSGAIELIQRLIASKQPAPQSDTATTNAAT